MEERLNDIELDSVGNVRDLGGTPVEGGRVVASGLFYRGSVLVNVSEHDRDVLFNQLGIACVIDLRTGWEREAKPDIEVEGVENLHIPFYDEEKVGLEYTTPAPGTIMIGRDVACDPGDYYRSLANPLTADQMRKGLEAAFDRALQARPVYEHCSGGKDRAGILALLILTVLGASREDILADYLATNAARDKNLEHVYERFLRLANGDGERARELTFEHRARPENLDAFYEAINGRYGTMDSFICNQLGIDDNRREHLRQALTR